MTAEKRDKPSWTWTHSPERAEELERKLAAHPYHGSGESRSLPRRTAEMHRVLQDMPAAMETTECPSCAYADKIPVAWAWRYYVEGQWRTQPEGHSALGHDVMIRECPQCRRSWFERPRDYTPLEEKS